MRAGCPPRWHEGSGLAMGLSGHAQRECAVRAPPPTPIPHPHHPVSSPTVIDPCMQCRQVQHALGRPWGTWRVVVWSGGTAAATQPLPPQPLRRQWRTRLHGQLRWQQQEVMPHQLSCRGASTCRWQRQPRPQEEQARAVAL